MKKCATEKIFHTIIQKADSFGMRGGTFAVDGNLAILDDTCQQIPFTNKPSVFGKIPEKADRITATGYLSKHQTVKNEGKTLRKNLQPEPCRTWRQSPESQFF